MHENIKKMKEYKTEEIQGIINQVRLSFNKPDYKKRSLEEYMDLFIESCMTAIEKEYVDDTPGSFNHFSCEIYNYARAQTIFNSNELKKKHLSKQNKGD